MDVNRIVRRVLWGVSTVIGLVVAEGIYRAGVSTLNKRELIGDGEVLSDETVMLADINANDISTPF